MAIRIPVLDVRKTTRWLMGPLEGAPRGGWESPKDLRPCFAFWGWSFQPDRWQGWALAEVCNDLSKALVLLFLPEDSPSCFFGARGKQEEPACRRPFSRPGREKNQVTQGPGPSALMSWHPRINEFSLVLNFQHFGQFQQDLPVVTWLSLYNCLFNCTYFSLCVSHTHTHTGKVSLFPPHLISFKRKPLWKGPQFCKWIFKAEYTNRPCGQGPYKLGSFILASRALLAKAKLSLLSLSANSKYYHCPKEGLKPPSQASQTRAL